jgi:glycosyltransferase involved in cell wall biosynthesis
VRNGAATFLRAAESVLQQDYPNLEYIVIDGGSTDGTLDLIHRLDRRIAIWVSEPDKGISDAFNKGIALSSGNIIGLLNSDDWYEPGAVTAVAAALRDKKNCVAYGKLQYWNDRQRTYLVTGDAALLHRGMTIGHPTVFAHRSCYQRCGLFRLEFRQAMDYEWLLRASLGGAKFEFVDRCLANMQEGGIGERHWVRSQRDVALARAMHYASTWASVEYWRYLAWASIKGWARRIFDASGLMALRHKYHIYFSPVRITRCHTRGVGKSDD